MKVLYVSYYNPRYLNTSVYRELALKKLGYEVIPFNDRSYLLPGRIRQKVKFLQNWDLKRMNLQMVKLAKKLKPQVFVAIGGYRVRPETLKTIKNLGIPLVLWTTDPPLNFESIVETAPHYDHIFCAGSEAKEILDEHGIKRSKWLPFACDPDFHKPLSISKEDKEKYSKDIAFVGAYYPNRWKTLKKLKDFNIGIWGPNWNLANDKNEHQIFMKDVRIGVFEWTKIYNTAKIVVIIHYQDGSTPCYQTSPKIYEALACKSFVLVDNQKDVFSQFEDGKHLVMFKNDQDLIDKATYYLNQGPQRREIAENGFNEVRKRHTYVDRLKDIFAYIN